MGDATAPSLVYSERAVPFALLAAADLLKVSVEAKPDAKLSKDATPELVFPGRWGAGCSLRSSLAVILWEATRSLPRWSRLNRDPRTCRDPG